MTHQAKGIGDNFQSILIPPYILLKFKPQTGDHHILEKAINRKVLIRKCDQSMHILQIIIFHTVVE